MVRKILKAIGLIIIGLILYFIINLLTKDGIKSFYCIKDDKCFTIWKKSNGEIYVIYGKYDNYKIPNDNYIKISNSKYEYITIILSHDNKLLVSTENSKLQEKSSSDLIELYEKNKYLNDSLYTYFDGKYRRYKKKVNYISLNIKENYATDKTGKKIE